MAQDKHYEVKRDIHLMLDDLARRLPQDLAVPTSIAVSRNLRGDINVRVTQRFFLPSSDRFDKISD